MPCTKQHLHILDTARLTNLSEHQKHAHGRHKCCQCAYSSGYKQGLQLRTHLVLNIDQLGDTQAEDDGRHRSVHQAFALGYADGVKAYIDAHQR